jgi:hypothetical protein
MDELFPGNSRSRPTPRPEENNPPVEDRKLDPIVGKVIKRKTPLGRRIKETFLSGNSGVFSYLFNDVFVPALKDLATDMVKQGIERAVYGEVRSSRSSTRGTGLGRTQVSYDRLSSNRHPAVRNVAPLRRSSHLESAEDLGEIILEDYVTAEVIVERMLESVRDYDHVTVANLKELIRETPKYTDNRWGWTDLSSIDIKRVREGFLLILPKPEPLR